MSFNSILISNLSRYWKTIFENLDLHTTDSIKYLSTYIHPNLRWEIYIIFLYDSLSSKNYTVTLLTS